MLDADIPTATVALGTAGGIVGGTVAALSRPMSRREVAFCLIGSLGIGAFLPVVCVTYWILPGIYAGAIGFAGGLSVFGVISKLQTWTGKKVDDIVAGGKP